MVEGRNKLKNIPPENAIITRFKGRLIERALSNICQRNRHKMKLTKKTQNAKIKIFLSALFISCASICRSILLNLKENNKRARLTATLRIMEEILLRVCINEVFAGQSFIRLQVLAAGLLYNFFG